MKLGLIVNPQNLHSAEPWLTDYHLVLMHLIVSDPVYREFYKRKAKEGHFITLDNSSFEVGDDVYTPEQLLDAAVEIGASEVMAPEHYGSATKTVSKVQSFMLAFRNLPQARRSKMKVFAVAHGSTFTSVLWCIERFVSYGIDTIGLSCRLDLFPTDPYDVRLSFSDTWRRSWTRIVLVKKILRDFTDQSRFPAIHLLGMNHPFELAYYKGSLIRSNDTSAPFVNAMLRRDMDRITYEKPKGVDPFRFGEMGEVELSRFVENIDLLQSFIG
jgi:hypothetical protein